MRSCSLSLLALALALPPARAADDFKLEEGFKLIFTGKNLDGWREHSGKKASLDGKTEAYRGRFKVKDAVLVIDPKVDGDVHIETTKQFGKGAHIKFDFKAGPKCNNDVYIVGTKFDIVPGHGETRKLTEGGWHTLEVVISGDKVEHKIDGAVIRTTKLKKDVKATPLRIRAEHGVIEIKNIRVKE